MFDQLKAINTRPESIVFGSAAGLWMDEHISKEMLKYHLNAEISSASRKMTFIDKSVEWITTRFNVKSGVNIADFGCGPGLYTTRLAKKEATVTGIDFSRNSIQYAMEIAKEESLSINYVNENYLEYETEDRFDLVLLIYCDFGVLDREQRGKLLSTFYTILKPGGYILMDVESLTNFERREESAIYGSNLQNQFWSPNEYFIFINTFKYEKEKVTVDKHTVIEAGSTKTIYNWMQYFSPEDLTQEFKKYGFSTENFYADVAGAPFDPEGNQFAVVARKMDSNHKG